MIILSITTVKEAYSASTLTIMGRGSWCGTAMGFERLNAFVELGQDRPDGVLK